jgi:hypothetical protein
MKLITVHDRMKLHQYGYRVALRFEGYNDEYNRVRRWLEANRGPDGMWSGGRADWYSHSGKAYWDSVENGSRQWNRRHYIGLRSKEDALLVMLAAS